jgi:hypothetical protein
MTKDNQPETMDELCALEAFFTEAHAQLRRGQILDMSGIDKRISSVCQKVQKAPPAQQQVYLPKLTALIELLNNYESELRKLQAAVTHTLPEAANNDDES